ncbi:hypothetical protein C4J81_16620 [Deltaproteobacteria bacterium Smac51]|nr:hypothetical protein C4J81_16620 [Deltaproteobacteria bacterium Smac51]
MSINHRYYFLIGPRDAKIYYVQIFSNFRLSKAFQFSLFSYRLTKQFALILQVPFLFLIFLTKFQWHNSMIQKSALNFWHSREIINFYFLT